MLNAKHSIGTRLIAFGLASLLVCPPVGAAPPQPAAPAPAADSADTSQSFNIRSILIFPFVNDAGDPGEAVAGRISDAVKLKLNLVGKLKATSYDHRLSSIERAVNDQVLSRDDVDGPFTDPQKSGRIASQINTDGYLIGGLESLTVDPNSKKVTLEVTATLYDTQTSVAVRSLGFTGTGVATSASEAQDAVLSDAVNDAASKIAAAINAGAPAATGKTVVKESARGGKSAGGSGVLLALLGAGLLIAAFHHGSSSSSSPPSSSGGGGGTTGGGPPPPPF
jgi:hypothetical protein